MEAARPAGKTRKKRIRAEKGGIDLTFMFLVLILLAIGLIMLFSASYASAYYETGNSFYYISRQLLFAIVGIIGMFVVANIDYHILAPVRLPHLHRHRLPAHPRALCPYP